LNEQLQLTVSTGFHDKASMILLSVSVYLFILDFRGTSRGVDVEESKILDNDENATDGQEPDGQRTDVLVPAWRTVVENKRKRSYSDVAKRRVKFQPRVSSKSESERRRRLPPHTLRQ
jgi:hypothetical protein